MSSLTQKKGQSSTEIMVVLAVVLIVAMVSVSLLGENMDHVGGVKSSQSTAYWASQTPIAISEMSAGAGGLVLRVKNNGVYPVQITGVLGKGAEVGITDSSWIEPGGTAIISDIAYGSLNPSSTCNPTTKSSGTLAISEFGFSYITSVGTGGESVMVSKTIRADSSMPLTIECNSPDVSCGASICGPGQTCCPDEVCRETCYAECGGGYCLEGESCCEVGDSPYCYNDEGGICDICNGKCNPKDSACCKSGECGKNGATCKDGGIACYGKICDPKSQECCAGTQTCVDIGTCGGGEDECGGTCDPVHEQCCPAAGNICIPSKLTCDGCGGVCEIDEFCCKNEGSYMCLVYGSVCHDGCEGSCGYETQMCCEEGPAPQCIPKEIACDVCGGCDPSGGACCTGDAMCMPNGAPCKDGTVACFGELCPLGQVCDEGTATCVEK